MDKKKPNDDLPEMLFGLLILIGMALISAGHVTVKKIQNDTSLYYKDNGRSLREKAMVNLLLGLAIGSVSILLGMFVRKVGYVFTVPAFWLISVAVVQLTAKIWIGKQQDQRITIDLLHRKAHNFSPLETVLADKNQIPLGISLKDYKPVAIPLMQCKEHLIVSGATGQGKTTLMMTMLIHALKHGQPAIIIDPKGEKEDIEKIRKLAKLYGKEDKFLLFSLAEPQNSALYNPLQLGTDEQKKAKLMDGLDLNHEYYAALASKYIGTMVAVLDYLKLPVTISQMTKLLRSEKETAHIQETLNQKLDQEAKDLYERLTSVLKLDKKDLAGLSAQFESLDAKEFDGLLSPSPNDPNQIDFLDVLSNGKIAYFQMNVNGYGDFARRVGKLIIQDLKLLSSLIHAQQSHVKPEFAPCFIDEFGSFATRNFADFLKMVRSANIGVHLFCQGMADLKAISPEFEDQVLGNTIAKIVFRQDINVDVEKWAGMAGTANDVALSFQVDHGIGGANKTGLGNLHDVKKMKIDFDVFKNLKRGQAVLIDKGRGIEDLFQVWRASDILGNRLAVETASSKNMNGSFKPTKDLRLSQIGNDLERRQQNFKRLRERIGKV